MSSCKSYKLFISALFFPTFVLPFVLSSPIIPTSPYDKFIYFAKENECIMPKDLKLPFQESSDTSSFKYFSTLTECRTVDDTNEYNEANMLCTEIFDALTNITCVRYNQPLSVIESDHFSEDVCHDFENLKDILPQKDNYLSGRLSDKLICKVLCSEEKYELCKVLLWNYDTLMKIKQVTDDHSEKQVQKTGNESIDKVSSDKVISPVQPDSVSVKSETISQNMKEPDKTKTVGSMNPDDGNLLESNLTQIDQESHNPKVSSDLGETAASQGISSKKDLPDTQVHFEATDKTTSIAKNVATTVQQNKSETQNEKLSPEISVNSVKHVESKNLSSVKPQSENIYDNENKIDVSVTPKKVIDSEAKVNKNSLTSNENEIKDNQDIKNVTTYNSQNNGNDNVGSKEVKGDSNVGSKTSEKSAELVSPATENDNELKSSNFPEEEDKSKQTDLESPKGKEIEKPKQTDDESPNEVLPNIDSKLPEPSTPSSRPDEDNDHQEDKDQDQYNDIENDADYAKPEYDSSFNLASKNKESVVQNPVAASSNQMTNSYGTNIIPKDNINRISEEIAMIAPFPEQEDGHFFFYFLSIVLIIMAGYLIFHNKQKIIALIVEGRHERRRRSHGAGYKKLETK